LSDDFQIEVKRTTDLQIETSALRKRIEEERNRNDLNTEMLRKLETRIGKLENLDVELKQNQSAFIDKISSAIWNKRRPGRIGRRTLMRSPNC
jgi:porphobilinogen deaminase